MTATPPIPPVGPDTEGLPPTDIRRHVVDLIRLATPVVIARIGIITLSFVDTVMVGHFSAQELAYQGIALAPLGAVVMTGVGLLTGVLVFAANAHGAGSPTAAGAVWRRSVGYALLLGVLGGLFCLLGAPFLRLAGIEDDLAAGGGAVMAVIGIGLPAQMLFVACSFFLEGIKRPLPGMVAMLLANVVNIFANWVLVYGVFGLPAMGAVGSAWATTLIRCGLAVSMLAYVWWLRDRELYAIRRPAPGGWRSWGPMRRLGYAAGISIGVEATAFAMMGLFAGRLGEVPLGAYSIAINLLALVFMVAIGIGTATAVRVGIAHGQGDIRNMARAGWAGLAVNSIAMAGFGAAFVFGAPLFARAYTDDSAVLAAVVPLIAFSATILVADGGQGVMAGALRGRGDTWIPTLYHVLAYFCVMIPLGWWLALQRGHGALGLFEAIFVASVVSVSLLGWRFYVLARRDRVAPLPVSVRA